MFHSDSSTSAVLVNKVDSDELDEGDFDIDLDEDVNDEELQKLVLDIKNKSISGNNQVLNFKIFLPLILLKLLYYNYFFLQ